MLQRLWLSLRKNKLGYYIKSIGRELFPKSMYRARLRAKLHSAESESIAARVAYCNKLTPGAALSDRAIPLAQLALFGDPKAYNFDAREYTRYFPQHLKAEFLFGDIIYTTEHPTIQKSRPITEENSNSVLLNLDKKRHFFFIKDRIPFSRKKDMLVGRAAVHQPHRIRFMERYFDHPLCDLGQVNETGGNPLWRKEKLHIVDHLQYKFILSLEGNDVATNLKWIMSSNSLAVMPKPKFETWFMEGLLQPDVHYVCIKDDYSDLEERVRFYINNPAAAEKIVANANAWVKQFQDKHTEDIVALKVLEKYFGCTGQP